MVSFLFVCGLLIGVGGAMIAAACVVLTATAAFAWLKAAILDARINQPQTIERLR
jgi:hypothetical protein